MVDAGALVSAGALSLPEPEGAADAEALGSSPSPTSTLVGSRVPHRLWMSVLHLPCARESPTLASLQSAKACWQMN